jgi:hypothetical protein
MDNNKKLFLEKGKWLTNGSKILSVALAIIINILYFVFKKDVMDLGKQKSLLFLCSFIVLVFLPIDFSIIIKNIIAKKLE